MIWAIKPESVVVSGDASVLNDMDSIVLDSFDLLSVTTESTSHSYAILVPDGCENLSGVTRATLEIGYPDKTVARMLTTHNIRVENALGQPERGASDTGTLRADLRHSGGDGGHHR